jgi:hypothetical protein
MPLNIKPFRAKEAEKLAAELSPLILLNNISLPIPGLTKPFMCEIKSKARWENCGRDPVSQQFFINE